MGAATLSLFADDVHGYWCIETVAQFHEARGHICRLVQQLTECGMSVNFKKSVAVLALRGSEVAGIKRKYVKRRGGRYVLIIGTNPCTGVDHTLPVEDKMEYLGVVLSYGAMESQSLQYRGARAWANYTKLKPILRTNSMFGQAHRLRVFKACVIPALLCGLAGVGFTAASLREMLSILARMLRKVLRIYEPGVTNRVVLERAALDLEGTLRLRLLQQQQSTQADGNCAPALASTTLDRTQDILDELDRIQTLPATGLVEVDRTGEAVSCPLCGVEFNNTRSLDAHYTTSHPEVHQDSRTSFNRREHALFGLPQCRLCRVRLFDWASLERHFTEGTCTRLKLAAAKGESMQQVMRQVVVAASPPIPPTQGCNLRDGPPTVLLQRSLADLPGHATIIAQFSKICLLCGQRVKDAGLKNQEPLESIA